MEFEELMIFAVKFLSVINDFRIEKKETSSSYGTYLPQELLTRIITRRYDGKTPDHVGVLKMSRLDLAFLDFYNT